jgi:hypothetical protein
MPTTRGSAWLDRRASNAALVAESRAAIARGRRMVETSDQLMRTSAKLMPRSSLEDPPRRMRSAREWQAEMNDAVCRRVSAERRETEVLRQVGHSLRSYAEEMVVELQEIRWQAQETRERSRVQRARSQELARSPARRVKDTAYQVIVDGLHGWGVEVACAGHFQSVRGFCTQLDALLWIAYQKSTENAGAAPDQSRTAADL